MATAMRDGTDGGDSVTPDQFRAGLAELDARIADLEARLTWRFAGVLLAQTAAMAAIISCGCSARHPDAEPTTPEREFERSPPPRDIGE